MRMLLGVAVLLSVGCAASIVTAETSIVEQFDQVARDGPALAQAILDAESPDEVKALLREWRFVIQVHLLRLAAQRIEEQVRKLLAAADELSRFEIRQAVIHALSHEER